MEIGYINGLDLGVGFNTATYDIHPTPALDNVTAINPVINAGGQQVVFRVELASSTLSLSEQLSISARASLKYGIGASGSAKTSFVSSFKQNSFSVYVLVQVSVINEQTLLDLSQAKLSNKASQLFVSNPQQFITQYGDSFIYGLITGGEFFAVLEIESSTVSEFREIKASLSGKASFGLFSGSAGAEFEQSLQRITSSYQMKATIFRNGGSGALGSITPSDLVKQALDFPSEVVDGKAIPYEALVIPYNHIPHPVASPLDVSNQTTVLERLGAWRQKLLKYQNDLEFALDHSGQFPELNVSQVKDRYNDISLEIANIVSSANACFSDQSKCNLPVINLTLLESILPPQIDGVFGETMISGSERRDYWNTTTDKALTLATSPDPISITFPAGKFSSPPKVLVMLNTFDTDQATNARLEVVSDEITSGGFKILVRTWADAKVYNVGVTWMAYKE
jgi:hypothetical protein